MSDKVAIVTGASRGIGREVALALATAGAAVAVDYRSSAEEAAAVSSEICNRTDSIMVKADISDPSDVARLVSATLDRWGHIDILVNNAGAILRPADWADISDEIWHQTLDTNLSSVFYCTRSCANHLKETSGCIVNITSTYGMIGAAAIVAYAAAKAGIVSITKSFAKELAPNVRVNAVAPGNIDTAMTRSAGDVFILETIERTPLKRLGTTQDVASAVLFLTSGAASFITGQVLVVDGGHMLR